MAKSLPAMQETWVRSLGQEDPLKKGTATHSNILAWEIPWTEEPADYSPWGHKSQTQLSMHTHSAARKGLKFSSEDHRSGLITSGLRTWPLSCYIHQVQHCHPGVDTTQQWWPPSGHLSTDWTPTLMLDDTAGTLLRLEVLLPSLTLSGSLEISWGPSTPSGFFHRHTDSVLDTFSLFSGVTKEMLGSNYVLHRPWMPREGQRRKERGKKTGSFTMKNCKPDFYRIESRKL